MHQLTRFSLKWPRLTLAVLLGITCLLGAGVPKVKTAFGFRVLIGDSHPSIQTLDAMIEEFGGGLPVQIAWQCGTGHPCRNALDEVSLAMANSVSQELSTAKRVRDVQGPANSPILVPDEQGFRVRRLVEHGRVAQDIGHLAEIALQDPHWIGNLISEDGLTGVITVQPSDNRPSTDQVTMEAIHRALSPFEASGFSYYLAGEAPRISAGEGLSRSTNRLIPVLVILIGSVLFALTRSWQQSLATLLSMGIALFWTLGVLGWLGWPQDGMLEVLTPVIVIVGVCDSIHLLTRYTEYKINSSGPLGNEEAILSAACDVGPACSITTMTTAGAFLSFTTSSLDTFYRFGIISAVGVTSCLLLTFTLLPLVVRLNLRWRESKTPDPERWTLALSAISMTALKRRGALLTAASVLVAFFGFGWASYLRADQNWLEAWGERNPLTQAIRFFESELGQSQKLEVQLNLPDYVQLEDPSTLKTVRSFSDSLASVEGLGPGVSVLVFLDQLKKTLHPGAESTDNSLASARANAELLELIELESPDFLGGWVNLDRSKLRISVAASEDSYSKRKQMMKNVKEVIGKTLPPDWRVDLSGDVALSHDWTRDVQNTQIRSFPIAFVIVFFLVAGFFRSWKLGLAAMIPTLLPVVIVLGSMGWLGMSLDVARAMIAAIIVGIGVDDAVHLLSSYKSERDKGARSSAAMKNALLLTGRAITTTSLALSLGFLALMMSDWATIASFGFFVAVAIIGALVATLFLLPALVLSPGFQENP